MDVEKQTWTKTIISIVAAFIIIIAAALILHFVEKAILKRVEAAGYQALRTKQSYPYIIDLEAGKSFPFWVEFKNVSEFSWPAGGANLVKLRTLSGGPSPLYHSSWPDEYTPARLEQEVRPGQIALFKFTLQAPAINGLYWEKFNLVTGPELIPGGSIEIPVRVFGGQEPTKPGIVPPAPAPTPIPVQPSNQEIWLNEIKGISVIGASVLAKYSQEPDIRVGIYFVEEKEKADYLPIQISTLNNQLYEIRDKNDYLLLRETNGDTLEINYDYSSSRYFVNRAGQRYLMTDSYLKFVSPNPAIFKIANLQNKLSWDSNQPDNQFRGNLEIQYNPSTQRLWIINQLPIEEYLKGIKETRDTWPSEFLKAQIIAARTYALFRLENHKYTNTPTSEALFTLQASQADQVYQGYMSELRSPNTVNAVQSTKGIAVTYNNSIISAYYFANTDGRTRSCKEVYMCKEQQPYLISRNDPPGQGLTLRGHGVGLPQQGARVAVENGAQTEQILKYYYSDTELKKVY